MNTTQNFRQANKKITDFRQMAEAVEQLGVGDTVLLWMPDQTTPWKGEVAMEIKSHQFLLKGKGGGFRLDSSRYNVTLTPVKLKYPLPDHHVQAMMVVQSLYQSDAGYDQRTGEFGRGGVMYFDLVTEDYNVEEDVSSAEDGDEDAIERLNDSGIGFPPDFGWGRDLEFKALAEMGKLLGVRINNEGHSDNSLTCKFSVSNWAEVKRISDIISRDHVGGDDQIGLDTPYMAAQGFILYPDEDLVNGRSWGTGYGNVEGDLDEWLEEFKPGGTPGSKRAAANNLFQAVQRIASKHPETRQHLVAVLRDHAKTAHYQDSIQDDGDDDDGLMAREWGRAVHRKIINDTPVIGDPTGTRGDPSGKYGPYETHENSPPAGADGSPQRKKYNEWYRNNVCPEKGGCGAPWLKKGGADEDWAHTPQEAKKTLDLLKTLTEEWHPVRKALSKELGGLYQHLIEGLGGFWQNAASAGLRGQPIPKYTNIPKKLRDALSPELNEQLRKMFADLPARFRGIAQFSDLDVAIHLRDGTPRAKTAASKSFGSG